MTNATSAPTPSVSSGARYADRCFEDWSEGEILVSPAHRMTEERIISFAEEFDPQDFHIDPDKARSTFYGRLIASGWHTAAVMMRQLTTFLGPASMGSPGVDELRWHAPVHPDDELRLRLTVLETRASESRPDRGLVRVREEMLNQDDVVVMSQFATLMLRRRRAGTEPETDERESSGRESSGQQGHGGS